MLLYLKVEQETKNDVGHKSYSSNKKLGKSYKREERKKLAAKEKRLGFCMLFGGSCVPEEKTTFDKLSAFALPCLITHVARLSGNQSKK